jgi:hypothetical protein
MARNYKSEYNNYHSKPDQRANRSSRNKARRKMVSAGRIKKNDKRDVDHRDGNPRNNSLKNLRARPKKTNRSRKK